MFVGSKESTFTFRIQEEREIMGFSEDKTYRRFVIDSSSLDFYKGHNYDLYNMVHIGMSTRLHHTGGS